MEGTYEYECMRAELLGIEKPNQEDYEKTRLQRERREGEISAAETAECEALEHQHDQLHNTSGKFEELNSILSSTQQKLNRFKQTACGSLTNIFSRNNQGDVTKNTIGATNNDNSGDVAATSDVMTQDNFNNINSTDDIKPAIPSVMIRQAKLDIQQKMSSHLTQLDSLLSAAENAEISMAEQTKQMRKMTK